MAIDSPDQPLAGVRFPSGVLPWVAEHAHAIDAGVLPAREIFSDLANAEVLDLGAPSNSHGQLLQQAAVLESLASRSFSAGFALWGHRMCVEYLTLNGGSFAESVLPSMRAGKTIGSSAMAPGFKMAAGAGDLELSVTRNRSGRLRLSGRIAWASNLYPDAVAFAAAYGPRDEPGGHDRDSPVIVAFPLDSPGVEIGPDLELLALRGTVSTHVVLNDVPIDEEQILTEDFQSFIQHTRPTLSLLQASLCLGLATTSYRESRLNATGINEILSADIQQLGSRLGTAKQAFIDIASRVGTERPPAPRDVLSLRLEAGVLASELATLELKTAGGKAFITTSDTNRRYREATFIPLQAPSEAQLRWELDQA